MNSTTVAFKHHTLKELELGDKQIEFLENYNNADKDDLECDDNLYFVVSWLTNNLVVYKVFNTWKALKASV
jgi:hypothetical protein